jgi:hypothetical protein
MSSIWYKTKEHYVMMEGFMDKADELESDELWELITELREIATEYNDLSLKKAKREQRNIDLGEISSRYNTTIDQINKIIDAS